MRFLVFNAVVFSALAYLFVGSFGPVVPLFSPQERDSRFNMNAAVDHAAPNHAAPNHAVPNHAAPNHAAPDHAARPPAVAQQPAPPPSPAVISEPSIIAPYEPAIAGAVEPNTTAQQETELPPIQTAEYVAPVVAKEPQDLSLMTARERRKELNSLAREMDSLAIDKLFR